MERLNREYIELLNTDEEASEKFWKLDKRIRNDKKKCGVQTVKELIFSKIEDK